MQEPRGREHAVFSGGALMGGLVSFEPYWYAINRGGAAAGFFPFFFFFRWFLWLFNQESMLT